jgi:hypothetical protein
MNESYTLEQQLIQEEAEERAAWAICIAGAPYWCNRQFMTFAEIVAEIVAETECTQ